MASLQSRRHGKMTARVRPPADDPRLAESDHRISNSLTLTATLLRMQRERASDTAVRSAIRSAESRVLSIARFHAYLHQTGAQERVDLGDFFRETLPDIGDAIGLRCLLAVDPSTTLDVSERAARQLLLIVNELALNARKHAYDGREGGCISVELDGDGDGMLRITLADGGSGLPDGFDPANGSGLGLRIVEALVSELGGTLACRTDGGAQFTITVPIC